MWMMNDRGRDQSKPPHDLLIGRKLRPLMPRPIRTTTSSSNHPPYSTISTPPPSCCCCSRNPKTLSWTHSITAAAAPVVSTRWNPTPEQLQALEEMYRRGIRTPSAEQIQQIAAKLRRFGRIEGKNVFYWFQNHKARERQKKRRQIELLAAKKQSGLSRRYFEIEKAPIPSNSSSTSSAESASMQMQGGAAMAAEGWAQHKLETAENETCWQIDLASCWPPNNSSITAHKATGQENTSPYAYENEENQTTLQLFPTVAAAAATHEICTSTIPTRIRPIEFIEFLPIKN